MAQSSARLSLSRRLAGQFLVFGLGGLFLWVAATMFLQARGMPEPPLPLIVAPLFVLGTGAFIQSRTARVSALVEDQLQGAAAGEEPLEKSLKSLPEASPAARAWNGVVQQLRRQQTLADLAGRISNLGSPVEQQRLEALFHSVADGVVLCDRGHAPLLANCSARALLGLPAEGALGGQSIVALLSAVLPAEAHEPLQHLAAGPSQGSAEIKRGSDLSAGVWRICRTPLVTAAPGDEHTVWIIRDITQQRLAEEMRNQFVFTATHELRTPLTNIRAYAELLATQSEIPIEEQKSFYNIINSEATRLSRFIDDLLSISQMEAGALSITRHETDVERLAEEIVAHVTPHATQKRQRLETHLPTKCPKIRIDKDKVSGALINLLGNAIKYTPEQGQIRFSIEQDQQELRFLVEDSGYGIAAEELPRLFEKFFRSSDTRVRQIIGSGLGLAFTQEVARLHGGKLTVASELNKGSLFTLTLPLT